MLQRRVARVIVAALVGMVVLIAAVALGASPIFQDDAIFGPGQTNQFHSAARARVVELQMAPFTVDGGLGSCGVFDHQATTDLINFTGGDGEGIARSFCVRNVGGSANKTMTLKFFVGGGT